MGKPALKKIDPASESLVKLGLFSKAEAAQFICGGYRHVHSSSLGKAEPDAKATVQLIESREELKYSWELPKQLEIEVIERSEQRRESIDHMLKTLELGAKKQLAERVSQVAEEMITNSLYHAYFGKNGESKYPRRQSVELQKEEFLEFSYAMSPNGVLLSIEDKGGKLDFTKIQEAFNRCYAKLENQIAEKESGAGLGFYMIFDLSTHLRIDVAPGHTKISSFIADHKNFDPDFFSFNFFSWRKKDGQ